MTKQESIDMVQEVYERAGEPKIIISNSYGADSLAMILAMQEAGIPIEQAPQFSYYWPIGDNADPLPWQAEHRKYIDGKLGIKSKFFPSPLYLQAKAAQFLIDPISEMVADDLKGTPHEIGYYTTSQVEHICKCSYGIENDNYLTAVGVKVGDSVPRRKALTQCQGISKDKFYPIWKYEKGDIAKILERHGVKCSFDYELFGISFESPFFHYEFLPLMRRTKTTWNKICEEFPLLPMHAARFLRYYPERENFKEKIKTLQLRKRGLIYEYAGN